MRQVQDLNTNEVIDIDDKELPNAVLTGNVAIPAGEYDFENQLGERIKVPAEQFKEAVDAGYKYVNQDIVQEEKLEEKYGDSALRAAGEGVLRSLTLGVSDQLLARDEEAREGLAARKKFSPIAAGLGEGIGIVAPILATGGGAGLARGAGAKILEKTAAGQVAKLGAAAGKGASSLVKNEVAKGAVKLGVEGGIEGALLGVQKTISEDALGDTEFNAESLMANVGTMALGGATFGGALGATGAVISRIGRGAVDKFRAKEISKLDIPESEKAVLLEQAKQGKVMQEIAEDFEQPDLKQAVNELGFKSPMPLSVASPIETTKRLGTTIAENPSLPGIIERKTLDNFINETQKKIDESFFKPAKDSTPFELGQQAKKAIFEGNNELIQPARDNYQRIFNDLGEAPAGDRAIKLLQGRLKNSDLVALGMDKGLAQKLSDVAPALTTINRIDKFKKGIQNELKLAIKNGDFNQAEILGDVRDTLDRVLRKGIENAALKAGPKTGPKLAKQYLKAFDEANAMYRKTFVKYEPLAKSLGINVKRVDDITDYIEALPEEELGKRLLNLNDYSAALELRKKTPELFDIARGRKLGELLTKIKDPKGNISPQKFLTEVGKMTPEQKKILFGFDNASQKRLEQITTVVKQLPKGYGSDTARNLSFMDILNPVFQGREILRYALYRGGDKAIREYLLKTQPILTAVEANTNRTKSSISSAVNGFYRSATPAVAVGALQLKEDRKTENAKKVYEQIYNDPQGYIDRFMVKNKDLMESAPNVTTALQQKLISGMRFLQSKVPQKKTEFISHEYTPSRSELLAFQEYVEAVENPNKVFEKMKQGYISPRHIEALKVVYPKLYSVLQDDLNAKLPKNLSKYQKTMLQQLLGVKVAPTASYQQLNAMALPQLQQMSAQKVGRVPVSGAKMLKQAERSAAGTFDMTMNRE